MRLKVRIVRINEDWSVLAVDEQSEIRFEKFEASNGVVVDSYNFPDWDDRAIFLRGQNNLSDTGPVRIPNKDVPRIVTALKEFIAERCEGTTVATQDVIVLEGGAA